MRVSIAVVVTCLGIVGISRADDASASVRRPTNIPPQVLRPALQQLAKERDRQLVFRTDWLGDLKTHGVTGELTFDEALAALLEGTGMTYRYLDERTVTVLPVATAPPVKPQPREEEKEAQKSRGLWERFRLTQADVPAATRSEEAQEASASSSSAVRVEMTEVVVSARKKAAAESAQDVPIAVTALSGAQLQNIHADNLTSIGRLMPNVLLTNNGNTPSTQNFQIRGMGLFSSVPSDEPTVGLFTDGMYLGVNLGASTDLFDLESVEVLRGPQGTLFGRNVTGGAVLLRSRLPSGAPEARFRATLGSYDQRDFAFAIENSLGSDRVAGKLAILSKSRDGYWKNLAIPGDRVGGDKSTIVKPILTFKPSQTVQINLIGEYGYQDAGALNTRLVRDYTVSAALPTPDPDENMSHDQISASTLKWKHGIVEADVALGQGKLTSVTGYRTVENSGGGDVDGSSAPIFAATFGLDQHQVSEELRYASTIGSALDYTVGAYYFRQVYDYEETRRLLSDTVRQAMKGGIRQSAYALFAQGTYALNDQWSATIGGRYSGETKHAEVFSVGECTFDFATCTGGFFQKKTWSFPGGHADIAWKPGDDLLLYASWSSSFRSGGYTVRNFSPAIPAGPYNEEKVNAYELGLKSDLADGRVRLNASIFNNKYKDLQRRVINSQLQNLILNAADATIRGAELELTLLATRNWVIRASAGYLDGSYSSFNGLDVTGDNVPDPDLARNLRISNVPKWTRYLDVTRDIPVGAGGTLTLWASYGFVDKTFGDDANRIPLDSYDLIDASITYAPAGGRLKVSAFGKNLADKVYTKFAVRSALFDYSYAELPRTLGVELTYQF